MEEEKGGQMKTVDIIKMIRADIDRNEHDIGNLRTKLQYSLALLDRIEHRGLEEKKVELPKMRKETL
jgi:hypothetical protein